MQTRIGDDHVAVRFLGSSNSTADNTFCALAGGNTLSGWTKKRSQSADYLVGI